MLSQKNQLGFFDDESAQDLPLSTVGKMLQFSPHKFIKALGEHGIIFKRKSSEAWEAYQSYVAKGLFRHNSGELVPHMQVKVTPKGYLFLKKLFQAQ